jgi:hypothetical protein
MAVTNNTCGLTAKPVNPSLFDLPIFSSGIQNRNDKDQGCRNRHQKAEKYALSVDRFAPVQLSLNRILRFHQIQGLLFHRFHRGCN